MYLEGGKENGKKGQARKKKRRVSEWRMGKMVKDTLLSRKVQVALDIRYKAFVSMGSMEN